MYANSSMTSLCVRKSREKETLKKIALEFLLMYLPQHEISEREYPQLPSPGETQEIFLSLVPLYTLLLCVQSLKMG